MIRRLLGAAAPFAGMFLLSTTASAEVATFAYDALGRLRVEQYVGGPANGIIRTYTYDAAGNRTRTGTLTVTLPRVVSNATSAGAELRIKVSGSPTGMFTFSENGTFLGSAYVSNGAASVFLEGFPLGTHTITATYSEDGGVTPLFAFTFTLKVQNLSWLPAVLELLLSE